MFSRFGVQVVVLERGEQPLPREDRELEAGRVWSLRTAAECAGLEPSPAADASRIETK